MVVGTTLLTCALTDPKEQQRQAAAKSRQREAWLRELAELESFALDRLKKGTESGASGTVTDPIRTRSEGILCAVIGVRVMLSEPGSALRYAFNPPRELRVARRLFRELVIELEVRRKQQLKLAREGRNKRARLAPRLPEIKERVEALLAEGPLDREAIYEAVGKEFKVNGKKVSGSTIERLLHPRPR